MCNDTYNGWTNYETWNYKLWLDNEQESYSVWNKAAAEILAAAVPEYDWQTKEQAAQATLAHMLEDACEAWLEEWMPEQSGPFSDILNAGVSQINWYEIAQSYIDDIDVAA